MPSTPPLFTPEQFYSHFMGSETQAGFAQFMKLWQSSQSLRCLIRQVVNESRFQREKDEHQSSWGTKSETNNIAPTASNSVPRTMIEKGVISPPKIEEHTKVVYGGLSRKELLVLMEKYRAGKRNLGTYLLVRSWKIGSRYSDNTQDIRLEQFTLDCFSQAITDNDAYFFNEIANTINFLREEEFIEHGNWSHDPGYWWQFHLLLFILEHPKEKYAMREFIKYFQEEVGANEMPTTKTLRSFCRSHGITLNSRPGAPKKNKA